MKTPNPRAEARRKAGFRTQQEFADQLGWHRSSVGNVECGRIVPHPWYDWLLDLAVENRRLKGEIPDDKRS